MNWPVFQSVLLVGSGSFAGGVTRYLVASLIHKVHSPGFPYATLSVNLLGSLIIGLVLGFAEKNQMHDSATILLLGAGFCGGFTTFSTFAAENLAMLRDGNWVPFAVYTIVSVITGIALVFAGFAIAKG